jgi:hypothetical protein
MMTAEVIRGVGRPVTQTQCLAAITQTYYTYSINISGTNCACQQKLPLFTANKATVNKNDDTKQLLPDRMNANGLHEITPLTHFNQLTIFCRDTNKQFEI